MQWGHWDASTLALPRMPTPCELAAISQPTREAEPPTPLRGDSHRGEGTVPEEPGRSRGASLGLGKVRAGLGGSERGQGGDTALRVSSCLQPLPVPPQGLHNSR